MNAALALIIGKLYTPVAAIGARWVWEPNLVELKMGSKKDSKEFACFCSLFWKMKNHEKPRVLTISHCSKIWEMGPRCFRPHMFRSSTNTTCGWSRDPQPAAACDFIHEVSPKILGGCSGSCCRYVAIAILTLASMIFGYLQAIFFGVTKTRNGWDFLEVSARHSALGQAQHGLRM